MMAADVLIAVAGMAAGAAAFVLGVAQLTCEHAESPWAQRATTVLLGLCAAWTGIDCWEVLAGTDDTLDGQAVAFTVALALAWGARRAGGWRSERRQ